MTLYMILFCQHRNHVKSRSHSVNASYHSVQNLLTSGLLSENLNIKTNATVILPVVLYARETGLTLREEDSGYLRTGC
jgi:hypothetical protein